MYDVTSLVFDRNTFYFETSANFFEMDGNAELIPLTVVGSDSESTFTRVGAFVNETE